MRAHERRGAELGAWRNLAKLGAWLVLGCWLLMANWAFVAGFKLGEGWCLAAPFNLNFGFRGLATCNLAILRSRSMLHAASWGCL
jgi:hypothetical protein